jgi:hypothetical protein
VPDEAVRLDRAANSGDTSDSKVDYQTFEARAEAQHRLAAEMAPIVEMSTARALQLKEFHVTRSRCSRGQRTN